MRWAGWTRRPRNATRPGSQWSTAMKMQAWPSPASPPGPERDPSGVASAGLPTSSEARLCLACLLGARRKRHNDGASVSETSRAWKWLAGQNPGVGRRRSMGQVQAEFMAALSPTTGKVPHCIRSAAGRCMERRSCGQHYMCVTGDCPLAKSHF